ncbi:MAG TPA: N-acetylmuramoyl-L-alanine amidase [Gammaproteobacteria bacterium]|nr:N-acetylmuramoyl-L-alanine amidase [Gammaproteobacteria bacterium]
MKLFLTVLLSAFLGMLAQAAQIGNVRIWSEANRTQVIFDLSGPTHYRLFALTHPERIVIDIPNAQSPNQPLARPVLHDPVVARVRAAQHENNKLRLVLDLHQAAAVKSAIAPPQGQEGYRLVIKLTHRKQSSRPSIPPIRHDHPKGLAAPGSRITALALANNPSTEPLTGTEDRPVPDPPLAKPKTSPKTALQKDPARRDIVIAIDAGHGGKDPGARGVKGAREKDITLAIARRLSTLVNREAGMRAVMIRNGDYYLGLRDRMRKALTHKADLFISIHADAFEDQSIEGPSVYVLSEGGASSEAARWLAAQENAVDARIGDVSLKDKDPLLRSVLIDLSQSAVLDASIDIAGHVLNHLNKIGKTGKRQVQHAAFMVLKSPDIPSLLVETAYITNPREEQKLINPAYQQALAHAIINGIRTYFKQNAPRTLFVVR